jgi:hypothetical protein
LRAGLTAERLEFTSCAYGELQDAGSGRESSQETFHAGPSLHPERLDGHGSAGRSEAEAICHGQRLILERVALGLRRTFRSVDEHGLDNPEKKLVGIQVAVYEFSETMRRVHGFAEVRLRG